jgi:hypothetical protein
LVVTRRVSVRGSIMVGGQKIQVGLAYARKTVQVTVGPDTYQVAVETGITVTAARTASRDIRRQKASNTTPRPPAAPADLCPAGTLSAMLANVDDLDMLRHEFNAEDGSFLVQLRVDYHWGPAFCRL